MSLKAIDFPQCVDLLDRFMGYNATLAVALLGAVRRGATRVVSTACKRDEMAKKWQRNEEGGTQKAHMCHSNNKNKAFKTHAH